MRVPWRFLTVVSMAAVTSVLAPGLAGGASAASPTVLQIRTAASTSLADAANTQTQVESLGLAKGSWTVTSDVTAINFGAGDFVRCGLAIGGTAIDGGQTVYLANRVSGLVNVGTVTLSAPATAAVLCHHDHAAGSSGQFYVDPGATMTAVKGGPISGPGTTATKTTTVARNLATAATNLVHGGLTTVVTLHLPKGMWAVTGNAAMVNFGSNDFAYCVPDITSGSSVTNAFAEAGVGAPSADVTGLDIESVATVAKGGATVSLACASEFADDVYVDAGATLTATRVTASTVKERAVAQTALPVAGGQSTVVSSVTMPAGAWRVRSEVEVGDRFPNNGYGSSRDFLRCTLRANGSLIDGGATELITEDSYNQDVVNAGSFTATASWTLTLVCSHDATSTDGGRWTVASGDVQAVEKGPIN